MSYIQVKFVLEFFRIKISKSKFSAKMLISFWSFSFFFSFLNRNLPNLPILRWVAIMLKIYFCVQILLSRHKKTTLFEKAFFFGIFWANCTVTGFFFFFRIFQQKIRKIRIFLVVYYLSDFYLRSFVDYCLSFQSWVQIT